jgi:glycosyltransferase involved in cell wall biosynthesis
VLTTEGGIRDYVTPEAGVLCEVGDSQGMAEAVSSLLRDDSRLHEMQAGARQRALRFAWPLVAQRTVDVYRSVMCQ